MNKDELELVLKEHNKLLRGEEGGKRADLVVANLEGAYLVGANLRGADLRGVYLNLCKVSL